MDVIRERLANRTLSPGDRLPSIRRLAATMGVSPSTVVEAYDRLVADGVLRSQRGSGFYVSNRGLPPLQLAGPKPPEIREVDPFWVSRQSLDAEENALKPGCGWLPSEWMPGAAMQRALRGIARSQSHHLTDYGSTRGSPVLRQLVLARVAADGLVATPDNIVLTGSGTQALDLVCRFLLRPGETVLVDDPCYFNFQALLRAHKVKVIGVPMTPEGPDVDAFEHVLEAERPRLYITNSAIHNPTGVTLAPHVAYKLLSAAERYDLTIVEDDIFGDLEPEQSTRMAALDGLERVIRIGSFSKTLSASVRCGYIAARPDWIDGIVDLQVATSFGGPSPIAVEVITQVLKGGTYRKHMEELRRKLSIARREAVNHLAGLGVHPWIMPRGGFFLWCRLPDGVDSTRLARDAMKKNVVLAPGNVFSVSQSASQFMRFNAVYTLDPQARKTLADTLAELRKGL
ncbi:PLP-dependent aminotransferase family protein [Roseibium sp.]|uniref:aminotransferase-like domain-containing protein n=1 Tax=Roseibium sp. TaxID=1936156 RepID=UPI003A98028A